MGHPHFIHHCFLRLSLSAPCILTSPYFLPSLSPSLILLWPESQGRWSVQADAPPPSLSKWEKQSLDPKQTKAAGGRQAGKFTVQLIYDLTVFGFSSTGRQEAHRWSPKKKNRPIPKTHLDALEHTLLHRRRYATKTIRCARFNC